MRLKSINFLSLFLVSSYLFLSCENTRQMDDAVLKDVWKLEQAQINSFDPLDAYHSYHIQLVKQLFNTLTDIDSSGQLIPSLASSWETDDGKEWIFHLRDNVKFIDDTCFINNDDRIFKAQDVIFTFRRLLSSSSKSLGKSYYSNIYGVKEYSEGIVDSIIGMNFIDDFTISFRLINPDYGFPNLLSLPYCSIVKEIAINKYDSKQHPVGSGAFILEKYVPDYSVSLIKNPEYWEHDHNGSLPIVKRVEILLTNDDNYSFLVFKSKQADFIELSLPLVRQLDKSNISFKHNKLLIESAQLNFYLFNLEKINDAKVRLGINYAINREEIQKILGDNGQVAKSLYPTFFKNVCNPNPILEYNRQKAGELLTTSKRIKLVAFDDILSRSLANQLREDLKQFNINVEIESVPFSVLVDRLVSGKYDIIQLYWGMLYADINHFLSPFKSTAFPPSGNNFNRYKNEIFDSLVIKASQIPYEQQDEIYKEVETIILNDMPFILLYYKNSIFLSNSLYTLPMNSLLYKFYKNAVPVD